MAGILTISVISVLVFYAALFKSQWLIYLYVISLPFFGIIAEVGVQITPFLVVSAGMVLSLVVHPRQIVAPVSLIPFIIYAIGITFFMSFFLPNEVYNYPPLRGKFRWVSQILVFVLMYAPLIFVLSRNYNEEVINRIFKIYLIVVAVICITGVIQIMVSKITGKDIFPINFFIFSGEEDKLRSGLSRISIKEKILRMSGFGAGEPKHFGYTCAIALQLLIWLWIFRTKDQARNTILNLFLALLFIIGILFSLSTQSYLIAGLDICMVTFILIIKRGLASKKTLALIGMLGVASVIIYQNNFTRRMLELRLYERLTEEGAVEDFNQTIFSFLKAQPEFLPLGTGMGNVHFWAAEYIPKELTYYMRNSVFVAKAGFLRIISELGILGMILFIVAFGYAGWKLYRINRVRPSTTQSIVLGFLFLVMINFFVTSDASPYYIFALMLTFLCIQQAKDAIHFQEK